MKKLILATLISAFSFVSAGTITKVEEIKTPEKREMVVEVKSLEKKVLPSYENKGAYLIKDKDFIKKPICEKGKTKLIYGKKLKDKFDVVETSEEWRFSVKDGVKEVKGKKDSQDKKDKKHHRSTSELVSLYCVSY